MVDLFKIPQGRKDLILESIEFMSGVFWGPDLQFARMLRQGGYTELFSNLDDLLDGGLRPTIEQIEREVGRAANSDVVYDQINSSFVRLFVNARGGLEVPLYQSCYSSGNQGLMGPAAIQMKERFKAAGLALSEAYNEPADHLSIELEYLYFLLKTGWESGDEKRLAEAAEFTRRVLLSWTKEFSRRLSQQQQPTVYASCAVMLTRLLEYIAG